MLFYGTVLLSMKCHSESAIVRALADDKKNELVEARKGMTGMLTGYIASSPPWAMGHIRAALAVL